MRYNVGDKVVLRMDLKDGERYGGWLYFKDRTGAPGEVITISAVVTMATKESVYENNDIRGSFTSDDMIDHEATAYLKGVEETEGGLSMRYNIGDRVVLKDLTEGVTITRRGDGYYEYKGESHPIYISDEDIDHEMTALIQGGVIKSEDTNEKYAVNEEELQHAVGECLVLKDGREVRITDIVSGFWGGRLYKCTHKYDGNFPVGDCEIDHEETALMQGGLIKSVEIGDAIRPSHYRRGSGDFDLYEAWYHTLPFNEYRSVMHAIAERYIKRYKENRVEDLEKAIYTLERLKEKEEEQQ